MCWAEVYEETCALEGECFFFFPGSEHCQYCVLSPFLSVLQHSPETWKKKNTNCLTRGVTHAVKNGWSWNESIRETNWGTCHVVNNRETTLLSAFITAEDVAAASQRARPQSVSVVTRGRLTINMQEEDKLISLLTSMVNTCHCYFTPIIPGGSDHHPRLHISKLQLGLRT